jgi:hypothetical protein
MTGWERRRLETIKKPQENTETREQALDMQKEKKGKKKEKEKGEDRAATKNQAKGRSLIEGRSWLFRGPVRNLI